MAEVELPCQPAVATRRMPGSRQSSEVTPAGTETTLLLTDSDERKLIIAALTAAGTPVPNAESQARWLVEADLRGHRSHGLQRLPVILRRIRAKLTEPAADGRHEWRSEVLLSVDGERGLGPCVGERAIAALTPVASRYGVAVATIRNTNHLGILAPYTEDLAHRGLVGLAVTTSEALVHPWGGRTALIGTNPIALAVPTDGAPFSLDMATGMVSMGKVLHYQMMGRQLDRGWAVDVDGEPTLDPGAAVKGALSPFGGAKGYGLGLGIELLVSALTGSALGRAVTGTLDAQTICNKGDVLIALTPHDGIAPSISAYLDTIRRDLRGAAPSGPSIPGEGARARRMESRRHGLEFPEELLAEIHKLAEA